MYDELMMQRASIQESLLEAILDGSTVEVEFFRFLLVDIEGGIKALTDHLDRTKRF